MADILRAMEDAGTQQFYSVNPSTGLATLIGTTSIDGPSGLGYADGLMYTFAEDTNLLTRLNPSTGAIISSFASGINDVQAVTLLSRNVGYILQALNQLYIFSVATETVAFVAAITLSGSPLDLDSIAIDATGVLYGVTYLTGVKSIYTIHRTTGVATIVGSTGFTGASTIDLGVGASDTLYAIFNTQLYTINKSTGARTLVGTLTGGTGWIGIASGEDLGIAGSASLTYGTFDMPLGFKVTSIERGRAIPAVKHPRYDGARQQEGTRSGIRVTIEGGIYKGPLDQSNFRDRQDELRSSLGQGPSRLYLYSDRYYRDMEPESEPDRYIPTGFDRIDDIAISFIGPDPCMYDRNENSVLWHNPSGSPATKTYTHAGNTYALPTFAFLVGGTGTPTINWTIRNTRTGKLFNLAGAIAAGSTITVNCLTKAVTVSSTDRRDLFEYGFLTLESGDNLFQVTQTSGVISLVTATWTDRWE